MQNIGKVLSRHKLFAALVIVGFVATEVSQSQSMDASQEPSIEGFFRGLASNPSQLPKFEDLLNVQRKISEASSLDIQRALPVIMSDLQSPSTDVKVYAAAGLATVARRQDSAGLLRPYIKSIADLGDAADTRLQSAPALIFSLLRPEPTSEVVPPLVAFIRRKDRDIAAQASAISLLLRVAQDRREVLESVRAFVTRPMNTQSQVLTLNSLGNSQREVADKVLIQFVIRRLSDTDEGIRSTAAQVLGRMGTTAIRQAQPELEKLVNNPEESPQVKNWAQFALRRIKLDSN